MTAEDIYGLMFWFVEMSSKERRLLVSNLEFPYRKLCQRCFLKTHNLSSSTFYDIRKKFRNSSVVPFSSALHGNAGIAQSSAATLQAIAFVLQHAVQSGDYMPDCDEIHLTEHTWRLVYNRYMDHCREHSQISTLKQSAFYKLKNHPEISHIKCRKCKRFTACSCCVRIKQRIDRSMGVKRKFWEDQLTAHNNWQMKERLVQARHVQKATNPSTRHKYMVIMIDGMDHSKSDLPHFVRPPKDVDSALKLATHLTGVHVPGWKERPYTCFTWHDRFPTGSDSVITMILRVLVDYAKDHLLPPVLYLHMDNCWRENKNQFVLGLVHLLVWHGCFKKIYPAFLPVGHTHNIVDQMFSRFSIALRDSDFLTVAEIHRICAAGFTACACTCGKRWVVSEKSSKKSDDCKCKKVSLSSRVLTCMFVLSVVYLRLLVTVRI